MTQINQLTAVDEVSGGDLIPVWSTDNGGARKAALSTLLSYIMGNIPTQAQMVTQYAAPVATGFSVSVTDGEDSIWLVLTPLAGYAAGTIVLPSLASCTDKQEILVNTTQAVTTLTISGNGSTVIGAPTTLAANAFFRLRFDDVMNTWYRVG